MNELTQGLQLLFETSFDRIQEKEEGPEKTAQQVRAHTELLKSTILVPSIHIVASTIHNSWFMGSNILF